MNKIIVTPSGRKCYLEILLKYMQHEKSMSSFDEWHLWLNTNVPDDVAYIKSLPSIYPWIHCVEIPDITCVSSSNICRFFKFACDPQCVYIRIDDDIVYIEPGMFDRLFTFRIENVEPFIVYGNIINNAVIAHIHQRNQRFQANLKSGNICMDAVGWNNSEFAESLHRAFLHDIENKQVDKWHSSFNTWWLWDYERVSINCISWLGSTFKEFDGEVGIDEEQWLSVEKPRQLLKPNVILGNAVVAHYAFYTQREYLNTTDILQKYSDMAMTCLPSVALAAVDAVDALNAIN